VKPETPAQQSRESQRVIKLSIEADAQLADTLSDHLVGMYEAAVEFVVDQQGVNTVVHGFLQMTAYSDEKRMILEQQVAAYAQELADIFQVAQPLVRSEVVVDQDWSQKWKEHFKPFEIIPHLMIAPSWEPCEPPVGSRVIVMDPGMAFGTGHHATTRLCLQMLQEMVLKNPGCNVLDVGTGTGILGMAASLFGASEVMGIDNDQDAVTAARENVRKNHLEEKVNISGRNLGEIEQRYQLVIANIVHDVLAALAEDLARVTKPGGTLLLSGLIHGEQTESIAHCFQAKGFTLVEQRREREWGALRLEKSRES
jgi:ribosomal protein L11 methyltransferase